MIYEALRMALQAIRSYMLRTVLTMLGITIGIFAITLTFTLVDSLEYSISRNLSALGNTVLYVHNWPWKDNSEDWQKYFQRPKVSFDDYRALREGLQHVSALGFEASKNGETVRWESADVGNVSVKGVTQDYPKLTTLKVAQGRFFLPIETENGRPVVLLGANLAQNLLQGLNPLGTTVTVKGMRLKVIGVLDKQGANLFGQSQDDILLIPYPLFAQHYDLSARQIDRVISIRAERAEDVSLVESNIVGVMRRTRGLRPGVEDNFSVNKQESLMKQIGQITGALNVGGVFISSFALLVGGFGIANIMFVAVKERTREIGIQKALGATRFFILCEFLLEAIILCVIGALMGIALMLLILWGARAILSGMDVGLILVTSGGSLGLGLLFAVITGILSGLLPAMFAARLDPVAAMRAS